MVQANVVYHERLRSDSDTLILASPPKVIWKERISLAQLCNKRGLRIG